NSSLVLSNLVLTNAGDYTVTITNILGNTNSDVATIGVLPLPSNPYQAAVIGQFPRAYYPMNETEGSNAANIIDLTLNQAWYMNLPILGAPGASTNLGTSVTLDGVSQGVYVIDPNAMSIVSNMTMEAWVNVIDDSFDQTIISHSPAIPANPSKA